jgi:integrase
VSDLVNIYDRSIRAFAVKTPRRRLPPHSRNLADFGDITGNQQAMNPMDERIEAFLADVLALEGENDNASVRPLWSPTSATVNRTVAPVRRPNADLRTREHLTEAEVERLIAAAKGNRHGHRDATIILVAYRHGLRAAELVDLHWDQIDFRMALRHGVRLSEVLRLRAKIHLALAMRTVDRRRADSASL